MNFYNAKSLFDFLKNTNVKLFVNCGYLTVNAPAGVLSQWLKNYLSLYKDELTCILSREENLCIGKKETLDGGRFKRHVLH